MEQQQQAKEEVEEGGMGQGWTSGGQPSTL